jgi:hypothetical protein
VRAALSYLWRADAKSWHLHGAPAAFPPQTRNKAPEVLPMLALCFLAVATALAGLLAVGLALGTAAGVGATALLAAPAFGATSLVSGLAAAVLALRRYG